MLLYGPRGGRGARGWRRTCPTPVKVRRRCTARSGFRHGPLCAPCQPVPPVLGRGGALAARGSGTVLAGRGGACSTIAGLVTGCPAVVVRGVGDVTGGHRRPKATGRSAAAASCWAGLGRGDGRTPAVGMGFHGSRALAFQPKGTLRPPLCPKKFPGKFSKPKTGPPLICVGTRREIFQDKRAVSLCRGGRSLSFAAT